MKARLRAPRMPIDRISEALETGLWTLQRALQSPPDPMQEHPEQAQVQKQTRARFRNRRQKWTALRRERQMHLVLRPFEGIRIARRRVVEIAPAQSVQGEEAELRLPSEGQPV